MSEWDDIEAYQQHQEEIRNALRAWFDLAAERIARELAEMKAEQEEPDDE